MEIACAKCGSHDLSSHTYKGILQKKVLITCLKCGHKFEPGWDKEAMASPEMQEKEKIYRRNAIIFFVLLAAFAVTIGYFYLKG